MRLITNCEESVTSCFTLNQLCKYHFASNRLRHACSDCGVFRTSLSHASACCAYHALSLPETITLSICCGACAKDAATLASNAPTPIIMLLIFILSVVLKVLLLMSFGSCRHCIHQRAQTVRQKYRKPPPNLNIFRKSRRIVQCFRNSCVYKDRRANTE